jgi:membrane-associated phospholipid phosphatase
VKAPYNRITWENVRGALVRPYRVTLGMVVLVSLTLVYLVIAELAHTALTARPELPLDRLIPLAPAWSLVYGALYLFLILLPVFVLQDHGLIDRTVRAYLSVWLLSFAVFILYPTAAPRPEVVEGTGFAAWGLRFLYDADPPYNCFPSLHVAHSFVSALACARVHRPLGRFALLCAALVATSTLFIKQHYVADVVAGALLAVAACAVFYRGHSREAVPEKERRTAPALALVVAGIVGGVMMVYWIVYSFFSDAPLFAITN